MKTITPILMIATSLIFTTMSLSACASQKETAQAHQAYQSPGKPGAKAAINYRISKDRVAVGEVVQIYLSASNNKQDINVRLQTSDSLLLSDSSQVTFKAGENAQQGQEHIITVIPQSEGIHLVTLFAKELSVAYEKPIAIQIVAGSKPISEYLEINGTLEQQDDGETVIVMPAEEK